MLPQLAEIRARRKQAALTQSQLSQLSGVSQSLIAKLEAGKIVPSYDKAKRLFDSLETLRRKGERKASDIMTGRVYSVKADESVKKAVKVLERHGLSQLPVMEKGVPIGVISEKSILRELNCTDPRRCDFGKALAKDAMEEALPTVQPETPERALSAILRFSPAVLVMKKGRVAGIVTKSNLLQQIIRG